MTAFTGWQQFGIAYVGLLIVIVSVWAGIGKSREAGDLEEDQPAEVCDLDEYRNRDVDRARRIHPSNAKEGA